MPDDNNVYSLPSLARRQSGGQQWQSAIEDYRRRETPISERISGMTQGLGDLAQKAWNASLPVHLRDMYRDLQAGAAPEELAGRSMDAALRMLDYGVLMPGGGMPRNALGSLKLKRVGGWDNDMFGHYHRSFEMHNPAGEPVGRLELMYDAGSKELHVRGMDSYSYSPLKEGTMARELNPGAWSIGPAELQSLAPEIRREFPFAKTLVMQRSTGARTAGSPGFENLPILRRRLPWADDQS